MIRRALPILLLLSGISFAQTGTFIAQGYGLCQNTNPTSAPLYCSAYLYQGGVLKGSITFYLVGGTTITSGEVWRYDSSFQQTGYDTEVTGTIDTANSMVHFTFSGGFSGTADLGYKIQPGVCNRYCHPPRVVITTGIVTIN